MTQTTQEEIKDWFDSIYQTKGLEYLRPQSAYKIFLHHLDAKPGSNLLDVACGLGLMLKTASDAGFKASGIDISEEAIKGCQRFVPEANSQVANAEGLPFNDNQFDYVTCLGSLERMVDLPKVMRELHRVGSDDARYCLMVRNSNTFIWKFFKRFLGMQNRAGHQDAKSFSEWTVIFEKAGFTIQKVERDHWPIMRWKRWLSLGIFPVDYSKQPTSLLPFKYATEFVFILTKQ